MRKRIITYIVVLTGWAVWGCCLTASAQITTQHESWGYTSSYNAANRSVPSYRQPISASHVYTPACRSISAYDPAFQDGVKASTYFQYTPADALLSDNSSGIGGFHPGMRRSSGWDDTDDEDPIGVVPNTTPVGEPLVLLALALLYTLFLFFRGRLFSGRLYTFVENDPR